MTTENRPSAAQARAEIYRLLAECYHPPAAGTAAHARALGQVLQALCSEAARQMEAALQGGETAEQLSVDHARLFVGPFALLAPPYGSVYLDDGRQLMSASTLDAAACYREVGLDLASSFAGTPDHIAAELEFMYYLVFKQFGALTARDQVLAEYFQEKQHAFLETHLGAWVPQFTRDVETQAQTRFYRSLAAATRLWVESDLDLSVRAHDALERERPGDTGPAEVPRRHPQGARP